MSNFKQINVNIIIIAIQDVKQIYRPAFNSSIERDANINPQYGTIETKIYNKKLLLYFI